jgi:hypothetical protein
MGSRPAVAPRHARRALRYGSTELAPLRGRTTWWERGFVFALALAIAFFWFHRTWISPTNIQVGGVGDADEYSWFLGWMPWAISHGVNPLATSYVNYPHGINLLWNTSVILPSFVMSPVTVVFGAAFSYNVIITVAPALTTALAYMAFHRWAGRLPSLVGAMVFGFSPFIAAQSLGHLAQVLLMSAPLLLIMMDRLLAVQSSKPWRDGALLGALVWAQMLTSEETLAMEAVVTVSVIIILVLIKRAIIPDTHYASRAAVIAGGTFATLGAPFLAYQFLGPYKVEDAHPANVYVSDLLNFIIPTNMARFAPSSMLSVSSHFTGNGVEQDAYIGVPLLLFLVATFVLLRHSAVAWVAAAIATAAGALSLGPTLHVAGHVSPLPMPGWVLQHLPVLHNLLPARFAGVMFLGVGLLVALGLSELAWRSVPWKAAGWAVAGLGIWVILPMLSYPAAVSPRYPAFTTSWACPATTSKGGRPPVALVVPSLNEMTLLWQEETHFCFTMPSDRGMTGSNAGDVKLRLLLTIGKAGVAPPPLTPAVRQQAAVDLAALHIQEVIVCPEFPTSPTWSPEGQAQAVVWFEQLLGQLPEQYHETYFVYAWKHLPPLSEIASGDLPKVAGIPPVDLAPPTTTPTTAAGTPTTAGGTPASPSTTTGTTTTTGRTTTTGTTTTTVASVPKAG